MNRWSDIGSDNFKTLTKLRFPTEWLYLPITTTRKANIFYYKIRLFNDESIRWLCKQSIQQKLQYLPDKSNFIYTN
jgi:hypothetical protein